MAKNKKQILRTGKIYSSKIVVKNGKITLSFPKDCKKFFGLETSKIYWMPVNGQIHILGAKPNRIIPPLVVKSENFVAHE